MSEITPGNKDRAWNDPPLLTQSLKSGLNSKSFLEKRKMMNRRIPIPLDNMCSQQKVPFTSSVSCSLPPPVKPMIPSVDQKSCEQGEDALETSLATRDFLKVKDIFCRVFTLVSTVLQASELADTNEKLNQFFAMLQDNKLHNELVHHMQELAEALEDRLFDKAEFLYQKINDGDESVSWREGIKLIIEEYIRMERNKNPADVGLLAMCQPADDITEESIYPSAVKINLISIHITYNINVLKLNTDISDETIMDVSEEKFVMREHMRVVPYVSKA